MADSGSDQRPDDDPAAPEAQPDPEPERDSDDKSSREFSFSLPPISLPPLFPEAIEIGLPVPGYRTARTVSIGWTLMAILVFDLADALLALSGSGPVGLVRSVGGLLLAGMIAGPLGALYLWEVLAVVLGAGTVTAFPSLLVVGILGMLREKRAQAESET